MISDLFGILVIANTNVINHVILVSNCNCKCRKKLVDKLTEECNENIGEVKNSECNSTECNSVERIHKCSSCTQFLHIVLFSIIFTINIGIATYSVYYKSMYRNKENVPRYN